MGYEIQFKFFRKKPDSFGYDTDKEPEILKVNIGNQWDDVDLEEVAKSCFCQMAKRNILIIDAEVYEFAKKKVSFKIKDDGILLKNRKFVYDITGNLKSENDSCEAEKEEEHIEEKPKLGIISVEKINHPPIDKTPIRYEIFDPHPDVFAVIKSKGLMFTIGNRYPIYEEKPDNRGLLFGMSYITKDDKGNLRTMNDKCFVPEQNLTNGFEPNNVPNYIDKKVDEGKVPEIYTLGRRI